MSNISLSGEVYGVLNEVIRSLEAQWLTDHNVFFTYIHYCEPFDTLVPRAGYSGRLKISVIASESKQSPRIFYRPALRLVCPEWTPSKARWKLRGSGQALNFAGSIK